MNYPYKKCIILFPVNERENRASLLKEKHESFWKFLPQILFNKVVLPEPTEPIKITFLLLAFIISRLSRTEFGFFIV